MKITICIGSSCHLKGSHSVVEQLQALVAERGIGDKAELAGSFCMGNCVHGVCVDIDGKLFSVKPEEVNTFFEKEVMGRL